LKIEDLNKEREADVKEMIEMDEKDPHGWSLNEGKELVKKWK